MFRDPTKLLTLAALLILTTCVLPGCGGRGASHNRTTLALTADELAERFPWLSDTSKHWGQDVDLSSESVRGYSDLGCFPLGNGRIFTTSGLRYPFGTMRNIFGPTYQKRQGSLGWQEVVLIVGGKPRLLPRQRVEWVMRAGVVHTSLADADGVRLDIYDCVPPAGYCICRVILLTNGSARRLKGAKVALAHSAGGLEATGGRLVSDGPPRWVRIGFAGAQTETLDEMVSASLPEAAQQVNRTAVGAPGGTVVCPLGTLEPNESVAKLAYTIIAPGAEEADSQVQRLEQTGFDVLTETHDWWDDWYSDALTVECPDERVNEFIPIQQHIVRVQQADSGGYGPMYMYTYCWVRDSNGPIRFMTQSGKFEEVKKALDYFYACCAQSGKIPMNFPLDMAIKEPLLNLDWSKAPVERAEAPSFIILQHYWYWRQSGDMTPIEEHWEYLRRNLLGQRIDGRARLPFHGDETYRFPGYRIFERTQTEPTDWVSMDLMSADSAWEFIAAAGAMADWADLLEKSEQAAEFMARAMKVRDALDRLYWMEDHGYYAPAMSDFSGELHRYPFANINLRVPWLAADVRWWVLDGPPDTRPDRSALSALKLLWKDSGTAKTTPGCGYYVGMTPGMVVWALATIRHSSLDDAIDGLLAAASPSGGYSEMIEPDDNPSDEYWGKNRVRPWEGGINGEGLVFALMGLRLDAARKTVRLDPWTAPLSIENIRVGESFLYVSCLESDDRMDVKLRVEGRHPLDVRVLSSGGPPVRVEPGEQRTIRAAPAGATVASLPPMGLQPSPEPFDYGEPTFANKAKTIVVTWSKDTFAAYADRPSPAAIDTKIAFPPEYLAAALYDPSSGARRADVLVLDVEKYPGFSKAESFWTEGAGEKIIHRFRELGGKVETHPDPQDKPADLFGH